MSATIRHPAVRAAACAETLAAIRQKGVALAIWRRHLEPSLAAAVATWDDPAPRRAVLDAARPDGFTRGMPAPLAADVADLLARFARLGGWRRLEARLDVTLGVPCPRFHVDRVVSRLLCTYRGRGTQWLQDPVDPDDIAELATGDVAIMKGSIHADGTTALPHRSPPWSAVDGPRIVLVVDAEA